MRAVVRSIVLDRRLALFGLILVGLHAAGILLLYDVLPEFDMVSHFWFGYVLSEYSSKGASALNLQPLLTKQLQKRGWTISEVDRKADFLVRLSGFLLIGGLFWELLEVFSNPLFGVPVDSFFSLPITLSSIDGCLDVTIGLLGAILAFIINS